MKKLKKFLLIGLFSFLFIVNVNATSYTRNDFPDFSSYIGTNNYVIVYHYFGENSSANRVTLVYCNNNALLSTKYSYNDTSAAGSEYKCSSGYLLHRNLLYNSKVFTSFNAQSLYNRNFNFNNGLYSWGSEYSSKNGYVVGAEIYSDKTRLRILSDLQNSGVIYTQNDIYFSDNTHVILSKNIFVSSAEPTYTYTSKVLENGNVELTFIFEDYDNANSPYAFTIENELSGEEYGEENPFSSIFPKVIPYGNSYTITIPYDTYLYITLAKYNQLENSSLYSREEIFTDVIDINNIVFANPSNPYYSIDYQSQTFIQGQFNNTQNGDTCFVKFSNDLTTRQVSCSNSFSIDFDYNGYLTFYVKRKNNIIYTRNVNVLGNASSDYPYLTYNIQKQDFYSVITFNVVNDNYDINMSYRYSLDNGLTWTDYQLITATPPTYNINIFSNSNVIFEIVNSRDLDNIVVYDSKSVYVVIDISTASGLNTSTDNIIDKFISLISLNDNLINYINLSWNSIKNSKLFLPIMIPFVSSIICAIIYLIRRK